jgi:ABC-type multidrug transport system ATPase subunit
MRITLSDAGKRFNREWIFRHFNFEFTSGKSYAITGPNGSGKSTLLQVLSSSIENSEGTIEWLINNKKVEADQVYKTVSLAAPYLEVIEEMTVKEFLLFHGEFKNFLQDISVKDIISIIGLEKSTNKQIRYYSSGMKQRVKLAQAIFTDTPLLLLDEPCTNLDSSGYKLYHHLIKSYCKGKTIIVSSNDENEYSFCSEKINVADYKL